MKLIRQNHRESVEVLFEQIRILQHSILDDLERTYQARYAFGPKVAKIDDQNEVVIYTDKDGKGLPPSFNPALDVIPVSTSRMISDWFRNKRTDSDRRLDAAKAEFMKLDGHVQIAETINEAVTEYLDSLVNMRSKQKELGQTLVNKVGAIPGLAGLQAAALNLFKMDAKELEAQLPAPPNPRPAGGS
ncbi:MAG TPA: hypothetical protein VF767_10290 [Bryobacteraceae bacterium]